MQDSAEQLSLPVRPASVRVARAWVRDILDELGRSDLVQTAMLGVSELVTNAIIHGAPPVSVAVRGNAEHPRVEVHDGGAPMWRPMGLEAIKGTVGPATVGRGLALVAMSSMRWGTRMGDDQTHTIVWFEPAVEMHDGADLSPVLDPPGATPTTPAPWQDSTIRLINMPVRLYAEMRRHHFELRRELDLLVFAHPDDYPFAQRAIDAIDEASAQRRPESGFARLEDATDTETKSMDLTYSVRSSTPRALIALRTALEECYLAFDDVVLLTAEPSPEVREFQDWFFREVIDQSHGAAPTAWHGPLSLSRNSPTS